MPKVGAWWFGWKAFRISRKQRRQANIAKCEYEHDESFKSNTGTCVWWTRLGGILPCTLTTRQNLLATQEDIKRVRHFVVMGIGHGVEWSC